MDIAVDPLSEVPIYQQLRDRIVEAIASGDLTRGQGLASVRSLSSAFGINPATVAKAYELLREEGFVATTGRSGSVIARDPRSGPRAGGVVDSWRQRLHTVLAEAYAQGLPAEDVLAVCRDVLTAFTRS